MIYIVLIVFILCLVSGMPIVFALGLPGALYILLSGVPVTMIPAKLISGVDVFVLLAIPMFIPPICAALLAILFTREYAAPCAYISGVLGTLIGGDLLNLGKARKMGAGIVSIGGAGVFDGIFLVGVVSVILTAFFG